MTSATCERIAGGWRVRLPLRREDVAIERRTYVYEEVEVRREVVEEVEEITETVRREEVRVDPHGDVEATQRLVDAREHLPRR